MAMSFMRRPLFRHVVPVSGQFEWALARSPLVVFSRENVQESIHRLHYLIGLSNTMK